ncbi:LysR family transcriptional regulator [Brenneria izadpanahii]|uniref:LysR family transcriptional regulator n=1 Tax=Brenneria izadpanahii TaxID=2722756 RepID=A0ABX7UNL4_9GAMM|nr:LysR family transcriptional regulator [Brenneria izadpanahii]QTF06775.1 LysR family transcriptional regulator [Brenneria izadpanahii]
MDDKDWLIIRTVYELKNITRAAQQLHTSQPALSYRLRQIERKLNVQLFDMSGKVLTFTPQGEQIVYYADRILNDYQQMKEALLLADERLRGEIRIGAYSNYAAYRLPALMRRYHDRYPDVELRLVTGLSHDIFAQLQRGEIHLALVREETHWKEGKRVVDRNHYYAINRHPLALADLPTLPQIRISNMPYPYVGDTIDRWWNSVFSQPPHIVMTVDKIEICLELVKHGLGFALLADYLDFPPELHPQLLHDADGRALDNHTWLLYRHSAVFSPRLAHFIDLFSEEPQV